MVGVMHLSSLLLDEFERRHQIQVNDSDKQTIRLAALLHDVGHGPFSHTIEEVAESEFGFGHEQMTRHIINFDSEIARILGRKRHTIIDFLKGESIGGIPGELVIGDIGTDRMDYLIRDTYYTGLGHRPDLSTLISSIRLVNDDYGRTKRMAVRPEQIALVELLATTRYYHFGMIAHEENCRSHELLLIKAITEHLHSLPSTKRREYLKKVFSDYDDNQLVTDLRRHENRYMEALYEGRYLVPLYRIRLGEIRNYLARYCLFRLFYSNDSLRSYCRIISSRLSEAIKSSAEIIVDLDLWKHDVIDLISYRDTYRTERDSFTALLNDESSLLRDLAGAQALSSTLRIYAAPDLKSNVKKLASQIERNRDIMLSNWTLGPLTRRFINNHGLCKADQILILLHSLNDFFRELHPERDKLADKSTNVPYLRGSTRLTKVVQACMEKLDVPKISVKTTTVPGNSFVYSTELFSIVNALHHLGIVELHYLPEYNRDLGRFTQTYFVRIKERLIRNSVFEKGSHFNLLRHRFIKLFHSELDSFMFDKLFANEHMKVIPIKR
jgi:HD superfamily phosphohydrolase